MIYTVVSKVEEYMMKLRKIMFTVVALGLCTTPVLARRIASLDNFEVKGWGWNTTSYLPKSEDYGYVVNLERSRDLGSQRIIQYMVNSNGDARSEQQFVTCGYRYTFADRATPGYVYALKMKRENLMDGRLRLLGSWSPDEG